MTMTPLEALRELVACKDLKDRIDAIDSTVIDAQSFSERIPLEEEYLRRKPLAWAAARQALEEQAERRDRHDTDCALWRDPSQGKSCDCGYAERELARRAQAEQPVAAIEKALFSYRCQYQMYDDEGNGMALLDVFTPSTEQDVTLGRQEIELLADHIAVAINSLTAAQPDTRDGVIEALLKAAQKVKPIVGAAVAGSSNETRPLRQAAYEQLVAAIDAAKDSL